MINQQEENYTEALQGILLIAMCFGIITLVNHTEGLIRTTLIIVGTVMGIYGVYLLLPIPESYNHNQGEVTKSHRLDKEELDISSFDTSEGGDRISTPLHLPTYNENYYNSVVITKAHGRVMDRIKEEGNPYEQMRGRKWITHKKKIKIIQHFL